MKNKVIIPTEPVGSIPRSRELQGLIEQHKQGKINDEELNLAYDKAVKSVIELFEKTGSHPITDGEQSKSSFVTYPLENLTNLGSNGVVIEFADKHTRQLPLLTSAPFRYTNYAGRYVTQAKVFTKVPIKQAVIAISAISLIYPASGIVGYSKEEFLNDLIQEGVKDIRSCFDAGAHSVQIDFTEGRLAVKLDPSGNLLRDFVDINNKVLSHFSPEELKLIGVHTCPGGDCNSTHSADVDYTELIPDLLKINATNFFFQLAGEQNPEKVLKNISANLKPNQRAFIGVIDTCNEEVESEELVVKRILQAAKYIPIAQLGTTDNCGFSPFGDDIATTRALAFAKIAVRVQATAQAEKILSESI